MLSLTVYHGNEYSTTDGNRVDNVLIFKGIANAEICGSVKCCAMFDQCQETISGYWKCIQSVTWLCTCYMWMLQWDMIYRVVWRVIESVTAKFPLTTRFNINCNPWLCFHRYSRLLFTNKDRHCANVSVQEPSTNITSQCQCPTFAWRHRSTAVTSQC